MYPNDVLSNNLALVGAFNSIILHGVEPQIALGYVSEVWRFFAWVAAINVGLSVISELRIASYIQNSDGRGRTVPRRVRLALVWFQQMTDIALGVEKAEFQRMVRSVADKKAGDKRRHGCGSFSFMSSAIYCRHKSPIPAGSGSSGIHKGSAQMVSVVHRSAHASWK